MFRLFVILSLISINVTAQSIGGQHVFNFLDLPTSTQLTALGGINTSNQSDDIGLAFNNPSLLRKDMHGDLFLGFTSMYGGIKQFAVNGGFKSERLNTMFAAGVFFLSYGDIQSTDPSGNILGSFKASDYVVQLSAARKYGERWNYGVNLKFIQSSYGIYRSNGIALDAGVVYADTTRLLQVSLLLRNMGAQLKRYEGTEGDDLPFDIQLGISKRLANAPIQFTATAHHLHQFDIAYHDSLLNTEAVSGVDNIFRHFVFATQVYITDRLELTLAYNHLRRKELSTGKDGNGLNGFSLGVGLLFRKIQLRYARGYYQNSDAYNHFGLGLPLSDYGSKKSSN